MLLILLIMSSFLQHNSLYKAWDEDNIATYQGTYLRLDSSKKNRIKALKISIENGKIVVTCNCYYSTDPEKKMNSGIKMLTKLSIEGNRITGRVKHKCFSKCLNGSFVRKYPPANAKGAIEKGLLIDKEFLYKN